MIPPDTKSMTITIPYCIISFITNHHLSLRTVTGTKNIQTLSLSLSLNKIHLHKEVNLPNSADHGSRRDNGSTQESILQAG